MISAILYGSLVLTIVIIVGVLLYFLLRTKKKPWKLSRYILHGGLIFILTSSAVFTSALYFSKPISTLDSHQKVLPKTVGQKEVKDFFIMNEQNNALVIALNNRTLILAYFDLNTGELITKQHVALAQSDMMIRTAYGNDELYILAEKVNINVGADITYENPTIFHINVPAFIENGAVETVVENADHIWKNRTHYGYELVMYEKDNQLHVIKQFKNKPQTEITLKLPEKNGQFLSNKNGEHIYEAKNQDYVFCPNEEQFIPNKLSCDIPDNVPYYFDERSIYQWDVENNEYMTIEEQFVTGGMSVPVYSTKKELIFLARENFTEKVYLTYISDTSRWQKELDMDEHYGFESSITYENNELCYLQSLYDSQSQGYNDRAKCRSMKNGDVTFELDASEIESYVNKL